MIWFIICVAAASIFVIWRSEYKHKPLIYHIVKAGLRHCGLIRFFYRIDVINETMVVITRNMSGYEDVYPYDDIFIEIDKGIARIDHRFYVGCTRKYVNLADPDSVLSLGNAIAECLSHRFEEENHVY